MRASLHPVSVDRLGDAAAPAIVLLHASALNRRMWLPVTAALGTSYRLLVPDLPGHGTRRTERFTLPAAVACVSDLLREARGPALLAGDSLGGYVAIAAAAAQPARVAGVVAGGCTLNPVGLMALAVWRLGWQARITAWLRSPEATSAAEAATLRAAHPGAPVDEMIRAGLSARGRADGLLACAGTDFTRLAADIEGPVVLVNGAEDRAARRDESRFLAAVPGARLDTFPGRGHAVSLDEPEGFAQAITETARAAFRATTPASPAAH